MIMNLTGAIKEAQDLQEEFQVVRKVSIYFSFDFFTLFLSI